jgi:hypothetical protein
MATRERTTPTVHRNAVLGIATPPPHRGAFGSFRKECSGGLVYRKCSLVINLKTGFPLSSGLQVEQGKARETESARTIETI